MKSLVAIVGPTGIGKSRIALHLARKFDGEIVSADSRQVYRHMDIGTAKPSPQDRAQVRHHLIDIVEPDEDFSLAQYQKLAFSAIGDIQQRGKLPLLVGGSGLYVRAVLEGWQLPQAKPDPELRHRLEKQVADAGYEALYQELMKIDPAAAQKIDPRNVRRVIRALEVHGQTSRTPSRLQYRKALSYRTLLIGLTAERKELYRRVDKRVNEMIEQGLVAEVEKLVDLGYDFNLPAMSSIGYKQIAMFLRGEINLNDAIQQIKYETHRLIRHQYAWFRLDEARIHWFDMAQAQEAEVEALVSRFMEGRRNNKEVVSVSE
ncbi:MAG TPA: tRNA (adenosine(37)-N6)-dimethylallyltransferase MiaA [Dehalococcoidia bacterium]|nr:tRNA (adenosine(37)-N6)-dimethylallyltransferase MiaA [Dehalococcoidia bacterium]